MNVHNDICTFPNKKPWMAKKVYALIQGRDRAFKLRDRVLYSCARADLKHVIREAKREHTRKIEEHFTDNNTRQAWQGLKQITRYKCNCKCKYNHHHLGPGLRVRPP